MLTDHDGHSYQVITRYGELRRPTYRRRRRVTGACRYCQVSPRHRRLPLLSGHSTSSAPAAIVRSLYVIGACRVRYVIGVLPWHHIQTGLTKETLIFHSKWGPFLMPIMHFQSSLFVGSQNTLTITSYQNQLLLHHIDINRPNLSSVNCFGQVVRCSTGTQKDPVPKFESIWAYVPFQRLPELWTSSDCPPQCVKLFTCFTCGQRSVDRAFNIKYPTFVSHHFLDFPSQRQFLRKHHIYASQTKLATHPLIVGVGGAHVGFLGHVDVTYN